MILKTDDGSRGQRMIDDNPMKINKKNLLTRSV